MEADLEETVRLTILQHEVENEIFEQLSCSRLLLLSLLSLFFIVIVNRLEQFWMDWRQKLLDLSKQLKETQVTTTTTTTTTYIYIYIIVVIIFFNDMVVIVICCCCCCYCRMIIASQRTSANQRADLKKRIAHLMTWVIIIIIIIFIAIVIVVITINIVTLLLLKNDS